PSRPPSRLRLRCRAELGSHGKTWLSAVSKLRARARGTTFSADVMAVRTILHYPDPRLREKARPVAEVTPAIKKLVEDMAETMYAAPGVGLAATQIGEPHRIFVIDTANDDEPS